MDPICIRARAISPVMATGATSAAATSAARSAATSVHPTADEVFLAVRRHQTGISLATVYKSLETLVGCGLAVKLSYSDGSARYDGRTDPHHHARCLSCGRVTDVGGDVAAAEIDALSARATGRAKRDLRVGVTRRLTW